jgi:hypothetical protein
MTLWLLEEVCRCRNTILELLFFFDASPLLLNWDMQRSPFEQEEIDLNDWNCAVHLSMEQNYIIFYDILPQHLVAFTKRRDSSILTHVSDSPLELESLDPDSR